MSKRIIAVLAVVAAILAVAAVAVAYTGTPAQQWDQERDQLDSGPPAGSSWDGLPYFTSIRDLRSYFRTHTQTCINQTTLAATRSCVVNLQADLSRPGPAHSVAKDIHTATRQFGDDALHLLNNNG